MANNTTTIDALMPFKTFEEANKNLIQSPSPVYDDLINSFPGKSNGFQIVKLYRGFWIPEFSLRGALTMHDNFQCRPTDVFLASCPKSGTTWLKAIVFATMSRSIYPLDQHPLLTNGPHECVSFMENICSTGRIPLVDAIPFRRILGTHLPYTILHDSIIGFDCKIIYIWRDPKDVLASLYHILHYVFLEKGHNKAPFNEIFDIFCEGSSMFGPIWNHILGYWHERQRNPENFLFLKYEDMLQEPIQHLKILAEFLGCPFSETEEKHGVIRQIVELCSFEHLKDLEVNRTGRWEILSNNYSNAIYFRKGLVGDWRNHMTRDMAERLDNILKEKFKGSGLEIKYCEEELVENSSCMQ